MLKNRTARQRLKVEVNESSSGLNFFQLQQERPGERASTVAAADPPDARGLQRKLEKHVRPMQPASEPEPAGEAPSQRLSCTPLLRRTVKVLLAAGVLVVFGLVPLRTLLQASSVEAVVNARIITLRAPIEGEIIAAPTDLAASGVVPAGKPLLNIVNRRADRARLDDLRRQIGQLAAQRQAVETKLAAVRLSLTDLDRQAEQFRTGRIEQLSARAAELESLIAVAAARSDEASAAQERAVTLARSGNLSEAELARLRRDAIVAAQTEAAARHRLGTVSVELAAARSGTFLGDGSNDRPSSVQRGDEMRQRIVDLGADLVSLEAELARLNNEVAAEQRRHDSFADVAMTLPIAGRIWETLVSSGEQVRLGQDLVRLIDCATAVVTANVAEATYNRLSLGSAARFIPADGGQEVEGRIVNLTGLAGAPANLAIAPAALTKEAYRVTVSVPGLGSLQDCGVGRTGRVIFGGQAGTP